MNLPLRLPLHFPLTAAQDRLARDRLLAQSQLRSLKKSALARRRQRRCRRDVARIKPAAPLLRCWLAVVWLLAPLRRQAGEKSFRRAGGPAR
jgi:hypothetical protein